MKSSRRKFVLRAVSTVAIGSIGASTEAFATAEEVAQVLSEFTGGVEPSVGSLELDANDIAENGHSVPVSVTVDSPMTSDDYVEAIAIYAEGNPNPEVITFYFTPASGRAYATTRIRLARTQTLQAVAKMSDGSFVRATRDVKVTVGGCGGA